MRARTILLFASVALLALMVKSYLDGMLWSFVFKFTWTLSPLGLLLLSGVIAALLLASAVLTVAKTVVRGRGTESSTPALVLGIVTLVGLATASSKLPFWLLATGIIGLGMGTLIAEYRQAQWAVTMSFIDTIRRTAAPAILTCLAGLLVLFVVLLLTLVSVAHLSGNTTFLSETSPNGYWTVTGTDGDAGAIADGDVDISVSHRWLGLIDQSRTVYVGDSGNRPAIKWINARTLSVAGKTIDLFRDPEVNGY